MKIAVLPGDGIGGEIVAQAVQRVLKQGYRTADIHAAGTRMAGTQEMGAAVVSAL